MITASQKRKENIAEYLLYMWQIEDLIRANGLDIDKIRANVLERYNLDSIAVKRAIWSIAASVSFEISFPERRIIRTP